MSVLIINNYPYIHISADRLQQVSLLTTLHSSFYEPRLVRSNSTNRQFSYPWTERDYQHLPYNVFVTKKTFNPPFLMRHLAVFSKHNQGVTLAEVAISGPGKNCITWCYEFIRNEVNGVNKVSTVSS